MAHFPAVVGHLLGDASQKAVASATHDDGGQPAGPLLQVLGVGVGRIAQLLDDLS
jgi:hypothetical protein